jgi:hypothetical protein
MNAVTAAKIALAVYPTVKKISADRKAIKAARAERKFYEDFVANMNEKNTKQEPIRVKCERLA